jgi:hypothetical protein
MGKRWLIAVINKTWEIALSLWPHRNKVQEIVRSAKLRQTLKEQTTVIFAKGLTSVHPASRRLFTHKTMDERLKQRTPDLKAWVRVQLARRAAAKYARRRSRFPSLCSG